MHATRTSRWIAPLLLGAAAAQGQGVFDSLGTVDLAPRGAEIVAYHRAGNLVLCTDAARGEVHLLRAASWDPPALETVDAFPAADGTMAIPVPGRPTSVAVHPTQPLAIAVAAALNRRDRGEAVFIDLRDRSAGRVLRTQLVGHHPDSIAIAPDGRWALVANEAEYDRTTPGSIGVLDLRALSGWERDRLEPAPYRELDGLDRLLGVKPGACEPEFVAFDPRGRFAAVSCQENDAVVFVDLQADEPSLAGVVRLPKGAGPDGVCVLDGVPGPGGISAALLAVAEEDGQSVSFHLVNPERLADAPTLLSRVDVRPVLNANKPRKRRDPEGVVLCRAGDRIYALVAIERGDRVQRFDATDPKAPVPAGRVAVGSRPEGLAMIEQPDGLVVLTANEGDGSGGSLSVLRLRAAR